MSYDIGDRRKLVCEVRDELGALADPETMTFQMRNPDGTFTTYTYGVDPELARDGVGLYRVYWDCITDGSHKYRWVASGLLVAVAEEGRFSVKPTPFPAVE